ncbi:uncharacterized protein LOC120294764 [Eucalyptus grandis]|uniref:uncharacterized protein LOC120294764 n=1 Tax=Eucalyptus grandis TaxID=71139 RepID=UPI00192EC708|nr:uncharacterized protein LOC120294764 [Eucalyptus grandis]
MKRLVVLVLVPEGAAIFLFLLLFLLPQTLPPPVSSTPTLQTLPASVAAEVSRLRHDPNPDRAFSFFRPVASLWTLTFASSVCVLSPLHLPLSLFPPSSPCGRYHLTGEGR